jgi:hypothetical protein
MRCINRLAAILVTIYAASCFIQPVLAAGSEPWRWGDVDRIVVVPDIHGAYPAFVRLLQATDLVDDSLSWTGGDSHLVSLGDLLDRGAESRKVMDLLMRLQSEAPEVGGYVHVVAGNHELMNLMGDLRYVSKEEYKAFESDEPDSLRNAEFEKFRRTLEQSDVTETVARAAFDKQYPIGFFAHRKAFQADGLYGKWLTTLPAYTVVNETVFVHGGLPSIVAETPPDDFNEDFKAVTIRYLQLWRELIAEGVLPDDQIKDPGDLARAVAADAAQGDCLKKRAADCEEIQNSADAVAGSDLSKRLDEFIRLSEAPVLSSDGPLWYRGASYCRELFARPILEASLANLHATDVVVGHTTTPDARVHLLHDNKLTMLDTGMLVSHYKGRPAALIIENDQRTVQYLDPDERQAAVANDMPEANGLSQVGLIKVMRDGVVEDVDQSDDITRVRLQYNNKDVHAAFYPRGRKRLGERELAAYKLDQMLGFDLVPPTIERNLYGEDGALQLSYPDGLSESQRVERGLQFNGWCSMTDQFDLLHVWDTLIANAARTTDNVVYRQKLWRLQLTEHSQAFTSNKRLPKAISSGKAVLVLRPEVQQALRELNEATLTRELAGLLDKKSISALLARRDALLSLAGN